MKLVIQYHLDDNNTVIQPIKYSGKEDLLAAFTEAFRKARKSREEEIQKEAGLPLTERVKIWAKNAGNRESYDDFEIAGLNFQASTFRIYDAEESSLEHYLPKVYELEEWFERFSR